jgi:hemerythrin-like domain-containing protein
MHKMHASGFWQKHASLHPNFKRVKNWLWVHDRYRSQAKHLTSGTATAADFSKFHAKIEAHSEYEDTQLFQFFLDSKIKMPDGALQKLMEQHSDIRTVAEIQQGYGNSGRNNGKQKPMQPLLQEYVNNMLQHLDLEEKTIVGPWLQLTDEQYKKYRTYLSWKYCFMY